MTYSSNYLRRWVEDVVGDTTTIIADDVEDACYLCIVRKTNGVDKKTWGYVTAGSNVDMFHKFLTDNGVTLTTTIRNFINQCAAPRGARIVIDTKTFEGDKTQLCWGVTFRRQEDIFFYDRWNYSPHITDENVPLRGGIKFIYDLTQDKFVTLKVYEGAATDGVENPNVIFSIADDDSLTIVDEQMCGHLSLEHDLESITEIPTPYNSRFANEIPIAIALRDEAKNANGTTLALKLAERGSRTQGYFYSGFLRRKIHPDENKQPLFPPLS
jgi:hypothetical protein